MFLVGGGGAQICGQHGWRSHVIERVDPALWSLLRLRSDSRARAESASLRDQLFPGLFDFCRPGYRTTSNSQAVTITNFGGSPLNFSGISASGDFTEKDNCPGTLAAGASCVANVSFAPAVAGPETGLLTLNDDSETWVRRKPLLSRNRPPPAPPQLVSGNAQFLLLHDRDSSSQTVTVTNIGSGSVQIAGIAMDGDPSLVVQGSTCGSIISAGATCTVTVPSTHLPMAPLLAP